MAPETEDQFDYDDNGHDEVDPEAPDASDMDRDDEDDELDAVPCPYCNRPVYEHADVCPHCGSFLSFQNAPRHRPLWIVVAAILAILGIGWWAVWMLIGILTRS